MTRTFSAEEKSKLTNLLREGSTTLQEVEDLNGGLNDTVKAIAEEMQIKPSILKKAIAVAHKGNYRDQSDDFETLEQILSAANKLDT
jgi:transposase-like protein